MTDAEAPKEEPTSLYYYVGRRKLKGQKSPIHCFFELENGLSFIYFPKTPASRFKSCQIGTRYRVGASLPSFWPSCKEGQASPERSREWEVQDRATELAARRIDSSPHLTSMMDALRKARSSLPPTQRVAFDAWVLNSIR